MVHPALKSLELRNTTGPHGNAQVPLTYEPQRDFTQVNSSGNSAIHEGENPLSRTDLNKSGRLERAPEPLLDGDFRNFTHKGLLSLVSDGQSSKNLIAERLNAASIADYLIANAASHNLFSGMKQRLERQTFEKDLYHLLDNYSLDLVLEAKTPFEKAVAEAVRRSHQKVATNVSKKVYGEETVHVVNFSDDALFLINSHAFNTLRVRIGTLMKPSKSEDIRLVEAETQQLHPVELPSQHIPASELGTIPKPPKLEVNAEAETQQLHQLENPIHQPPALELNRNVFPRDWILERWHILDDNLDRYFRPPIAPGCQRLEWICKCGTALYGDFESTNSGEIDQIQLDLVEDVSQAGQDGLNEHKPGNDINTPSNQPPDTSLGSSSSSSQIPLRHLPGSSTFTTSMQAGSKIGSSIPTSFPTNPQLAISVPKYFAICVSAGDYLTIVGEIEVSSTRWDRDFFCKMWREYYKLRDFRSKRLRNLLIKPVDVKYVKFTIDYGTRNQRAVILSEPPDFPDQREVDAGRYEYMPCPPTITRPRPTAEVFLHYLKRPDCPTRKWFRRVPKKLSPAILHSYLQSQGDEDIIGWGVQIIEGPNKKAISWLCLILLVLSGTISVIYTQLRNDASSGFAIGAYLLTGGALLISAFYFQWSEQ